MTTGTPKPEDITRLNIAGPVGEEQKKPSMGAPSFQSYMQSGEPNPLLQGPKTAQVSPFDLAHGQVPAAGPTMTTLVAQANSAQSALGDLSNQLSTPNLKLKQSSKYILKNKLASAKANIRSASAKMGANEAPDKEIPTGAGPIQKFLALVTDGQNQLEEAKKQIQTLKDKGVGISPGDMLLIQIKLNKAQTEIEYSSVLLSKAVDDMKMLMNIQL